MTSIDTSHGGCAWEAFGSAGFLLLRLTRHKLHLHALLLENQPWFSARDLGRLLRLYIEERTLRKLDPDQHQTTRMLIHGTLEHTLLISESGVNALLIYHYCPEYRALREWLTHNVVPTLRDAEQPTTIERPMLSLLNWPDMSLSLLHWNNQPWIRCRMFRSWCPSRWFQYPLSMRLDGKEPRRCFTYSELKPHAFGVGSNKSQTTIRHSALIV